MAYTKLWQKILTSSVWNEDLVTKVVWITMLALKDEKHMVLGSIGGVAHQARVSLDQCRAAIRKLEEPDPDDSSKIAEGRRLIPVEGGWFVVNGERYRNSQDPEERRAIQAAYMRDYRKRKATVKNVITSNNGSLHVSDVSECKENGDFVNPSPLAPPQTPPLISPSSDQSTSKENKQKARKLAGAVDSVSLPECLDSEEFRTALQNWIDHKKLKKDPMTQYAVELVVKKCQRWGLKRAIEAINLSIERGWKGVFEMEQAPQNSTPQAKAQFVTREMVADWCSRKSWTKLTPIAWGKLMNGSYYGKPITNITDFDAAMSTIYEETDP